MGDFLNLTLFVYKKHHGHNQGGFWLFCTWQASSKIVKIHPSGDHAAFYRQRVWDFIYLPSEALDMNALDEEEEITYMYLTLQKKTHT